MIRRIADNPVVLIEQGAPHRIHNEETLASYTKALFQLTAKEEPTDAELETIDLLTLLIEDYESRYRMPQAEPREVLKYLMEKGGLRQQDLRAELGSLANISMILSGQRNLTLGNASALASRFKMDIRAFLPAATAKPVRAKGSRLKNVQAKAGSAASGRSQRKVAHLPAG